MLRLKWERIKREWTQEHLANLAGMAGSDISKIERGVLFPYKPQRERLAQALQIKPTDLLKEKK